MNILVVSGAPWDENNSFGNTYTSIFKDIEDLHFGNIFCKAGTLNNSFNMEGFQITEKSIIKNLFNPRYPTGRKVSSKKVNNENSANFKHYDTARKLRWGFFFTIRELIWIVGKWKTKELRDYIKEFNPDIMFIPIYHATYLNRVAQYVCKVANVPIIGYVSDDVYTLKQFSLSPFFWIKRILARTHIKKTVEKCELLYTVSKVQKKEYENIFALPCKILTKYSDFSDYLKPEFKEPEDIIKMTYAGNISNGRYEIISNLAMSVEKLNENGKKFELDIYTTSILKDKQKKKLLTESVHLHPPVSYNEIREIQKKSDILVHAEAFNLQEKLAVHQSFSTKIVDYLETNRCILAIGSDYCASIQYFIDNECGAVAKSFDEIETRLRELYENRNLFKYYADKAWESGKCNHNKADMQKMIIEDLKGVLIKN